MNKIETAAIVTLLIAPAIITMAGCSRDPVAVRKKYIESGLRFMKSGKTQEAVIQFQNALKLDPRSTDALYQLGKAHMANRDSTAAYNALRQVVDLDQNRVDAHIGLAEVYLNGRMFEQAQKEAELVIGKDPSNGPAFELLGLSLAPQLHTEDAL